MSAALAESPLSGVASPLPEAPFVSLASLAPPSLHPEQIRRAIWAGRLGCTVYRLAGGKRIALVVAAKDAEAARAALAAEAARPRRRGGAA
jgi:hypothetical protein